MIKFKIKHQHLNMRTICSQNVNLSETMGQRDFNFCIIILQLIYKTSIADSIDEDAHFN